VIFTWPSRFLPSVGRKQHEHASLQRSDGAHVSFVEARDATGESGRVSRAKTKRGSAGNGPQHPEVTLVERRDPGRLDSCRERDEGGVGEAQPEIPCCSATSMHSARAFAHHSTA